jgi:hypothetical protein
VTGVRRWPLLVIGAGAAVSVWSGWVALGGMCGFGLVHPLPGIAPGVELNTAITLPVGVEAYGAYALGAWLAAGEVGPGSPTTTARRFAKRSAIGALLLGVTGQVVYHLLAAAHATRAPWPVVVLVSCIPVVTLGLAAALTHLLRQPLSHRGVANDPARGELRQPDATENATAVPRAVPGPLPAEAQPFAAGLARGEIPSIRRIRGELHVGQPRAKEVQARLEALTPAGQRIRRIRGEIRQGAPVPEGSPAGASAHTPGVPGPPAGVTPNGHQPAERR